MKLIPDATPVALTSEERQPEDRIALKTELLQAVENGAFSAPLCP
jgi:hypothetical protein